MAVQLAVVAGSIEVAISLNNGLYWVTVVHDIAWHPLCIHRNVVR